MTQKIVYILGKDTRDAAARRKYADAETVITNLGCEALNPATLPAGIGPEPYMRICMELIGAADVVVLLPCWRYDTTAQREKRGAEKLGKLVEKYDNFVGARLKNPDGMAQMND